MTERNVIVRPRFGLLRRLRRALRRWQRPSSTAARIDDLSRHTLRDIGIEREPVDRLGICRLDAAIRRST